MSSAARIEELQRKFDENPRRYFAPLANECRKAGELDAAIAICRAHLPQQPGHMSGHIVYGQALFESGELAEARTVFETALGLDPENLIALRHMGDIAAREGDPVTARRWYVRVLETDPRNEEIQALVAGLPPAEGVPDVAPDQAEEGLPSLLDPALLAAAAEGEAESDSPFAGGTDELVPTILDESGEGESAEPSTAASEEAFTLDGFEATSFDGPAETGTGEATVSPVPLEMPALEMSEDLELGPPLDAGAVAAGSAPGSDYPDLDLDEPAVAAGGEPPTGTLAAPSFEHEPADSSPIQDPPSEPAATDAFVTETMAELYLRQGYRAEALDVYRRLVEQSPDDAALRERMARVEEEVSGAQAEAAAEPGREDAGDGDAVVPGLPEVLDPPLVAAAAEFAHGERPSREPMPASTGPTIREFLSALASHRPVSQESTSSYGAVEPEGDELTGEFGGAGETGTSGQTEVAEVLQLDEALTEPATAAEPAARPELAASDTASVTDAGQGLDRLFETAPAAADIAAAETLAQAYLPPTGSPEEPAVQVPPADPLSGRPARPAGNDLSLDHVFGAPRQSGAGRNSGGFSFDQFFADGTVRASHEETAEAAANPGDEEDLEQFNSWLHNLKNQ